VTLAAGVGSRQLQLGYDHLVIALGNVTSFAGQPGLSEHALPFKHLGDALVLRNHTIHALEEADIDRHPKARAGLLTFVVAGGGTSGVEAAAGLRGVVGAAARRSAAVPPEATRVDLRGAGDRIR